MSHYVDIDECYNNQDNCHKNAVCYNTIGNFECHCKGNYIGDGVLCIGKSKNMCTLLNPDIMHIIFGRTQIRHKWYLVHAIPPIATVSVPPCQNVVVFLAMKQSMKVVLKHAEVSDNKILCVYDAFNKCKGISSNTCCYFRSVHNSLHDNNIVYHHVLCVCVCVCVCV